MMTSLKFSTANYGDCLVETSSAHAGYPQSLMLRMMQNASRSMAHSMGRNLGRTGAPRLDPQSMSENLRRDIGVIDWGSCDRER